MAGGAVEVETGAAALAVDGGSPAWLVAPQAARTKAKQREASRRRMGGR